MNFEVMILVRLWWCISITVQTFHMEDLISFCLLCQKHNISAYVLPMKMHMRCLLFPKNLFMNKRNIFVFYLLLYSIYEESIRVVKIFEFLFSMDLHILGCPEHKFTIFTKCLSVCLCVTQIL